MATVSKGPYFWDVRGSGSQRNIFAASNRETVPQGSTYLETDGNHDIYICSAQPRFRGSKCNIQII